jgi:hypothetical protein
MAEGDEVWLFDSVMGFLEGPGWAKPVWDFIDDNCIIFDTEEENKLGYIDIFNLFRELVDQLLEMHLAEMGCSVEQFARLCETYGTTDVASGVMEQILAVDDFVTFKKMMVTRNTELEESALAALAKAGQQGADAVADDYGFDDEEAAIQAAIVASMMDDEQDGLHVAVTEEEAAAAREATEEAEMQRAIAASLAVEDEKQKMAAEGREVPVQIQRSAPPPPPQPSAAPAAPPAAPAMPPVRPPTGGGSGGGGGLLGPLPSLSAPPAAGSAELHRAAAALSEDVGAKAQEVRERAMAQREQEKVAAPVAQTASAEEVRKRAEHLKKQRDLIINQRKKQRDAASAASAAVAPPPAAPAAPPPPANGAMHRGAGFSSGDPTSDAHRARLSVALASSMKASLLGSDATSVDLEHKMEQHHRKIGARASRPRPRPPPRAARAACALLLPHSPVVSWQISR